jgi:hypothetical protein
MSLYGQFTPSLIASANADLSDNDLRNIANAAEGFTVTGVLTRRGIEVPRYDSTDPAYASMVAGPGAGAMIAAPDNLGSSVASNLYGTPRTAPVALVWIKNTGSRFLWYVFVTPDYPDPEPLAASASITCVLGAGKSTLIYARIVNHVRNDALLPGFLLLTANAKGPMEYATTADVVCLGLDSYWTDGDNT